MECGAALNEQIEELVTAARFAMRNAYAPYSRFAVGAAVRLKDGSIITGSNFENASYGLSLCAEAVAVASANAAGRLKDIEALAVAGGLIGRGMFRGMAFAVEPHGLWLWLLLAAGIGALAGYLPALRASRAGLYEALACE